MWSGDSKRWAQVFWNNYSKLKHDPTFVSDPFEVKVLQESAYLVLLAVILNRVAGSKRPAARIFQDYRHHQLKSWIREVLGI